jgi:DNA-binding response OmpR family regulator
MTQEEKPILIISRGTRNGQRVILDRESLLIGRDKDCDVVMSEQQISRHHIRIKAHGGRYMIEDLESKNGTWVNEEQLTGERPLEDGDEINLAKVVTLIFAESEATAPLIPGGSRLRLDADSRRVFIGDDEIIPPLSLPQYRLLELLVNANGAVCTRTDVVEAVWPEAISDGVSEQAIDALVRRLRDRLAEVDPEHQYIVTVRGHGFRLDQS